MESDLTNTSIALDIDHSAPDFISVSRPLATIGCLAVVDLLSVCSALLLAAAARNYFYKYAPTTIFAVMPITLVLILCSFVASGLYPGVSVNPVEELRRSSLSITLSFLVLWTGTFFLRDLSQSRFIYLLAFVLALLFVPLARVLARKAFAKKSWWGSPVAILGFGGTGQLLYQKLLGNPAIGLKPVAVLDDNSDRYSELDRHLFKGPLAACLELTAVHRISYGIVCMPGMSRHDLLNFIDRYGQCFGHLLVIPDLIGMTSLGITAKEVGGIVGLEVKQQLLRFSSKFIKRTLDLVFTIAAAPFLIPIVGIAALLVKFESRGPIFYANRRVGRRGKIFNAWKLRSMVVDGDKILEKYLDENPVEKAHWNATQKLKNDPRLTKVGRFIRKTSIDELPQFWNVFKGEMSVVGPRPIMQNQMAIYGPSLNLYRQVRPGITGLWQVSGRNHLSFEERVKLDKYVIQNWSLWLDLYILARTATALLTTDGAY